jgi:hypothetical protein
VYGNALAADHGERGDLGESETGADLYDDVAGSRFRAVWIEIIAGLERSINRHAIAGVAGMLDHHDRVGTRGHRSACHYFNSLTSSDRSFKKFAGADFADDMELARQIGGADRETVAGGAGKRRIIAIGDDVFGKDAAVSLIELRGFVLSQCEHFPKYTVARLFEAVSQIPV